MRLETKYFQVNPFHLKKIDFGRTIYSPCTLRSPKPTAKPVKVKAHMTPAVVNISFASIIIQVILYMYKSLLNIAFRIRFYPTQLMPEKN